MIPVTDSRINEYMMKLAKEDDPHLLEMEKIAKEKDFPIVGSLVGRLIFTLTRLHTPRLVVELGSGFGYSAYWFAKAMRRGTIVLTDYRDDHIQYAKELFVRTGLRTKAEFRVGDAVKIAKEYREIDILFIDIDKHQYLHAIQSLLPNLKRHALVIADNSLWYGKVAERSRDRATVGIKRFNKFLFSRKDFMTTILPLRDGVLLAYKIS
jgi:predicted O-methyltransferase YrrM